MPISGKRAHKRLGDVLPARADGLQVNACRTPGCKSYGVPPKVGPGQSDPKYHLDRMGSAKALHCLACGRRSTLISNAALQIEIERLETANGALDQARCRTKGCLFEGCSVARTPSAFRFYGKTPSGRRRYQCRGCGRTVSFGDEHKKLTKLHANRDIVDAIVNSVPIRGQLRTIDISAEALYRRVDFIWRQFQSFERYRLKRFFEMKKNETLTRVAEVA